ncbi:MAG: cytochrome P450 [Novosphingobium sp.]|nr:cytochrome P450 [Novosphingobium sp.]
MADTITADDERYAEMFSVADQDANRGVEDRDYSGALNALRERGPVLKGSPRALLGLPDVHDAHYLGPPRETYTLLSYHSCERGFRENLIFSSEVYKESSGIDAIGPNILAMIGQEHRSYRAVGQPMFLRPRVLDLWKRRWIDDAVAMLLDRLHGRDAVDLNMELCARLPMYVVTRGIVTDAADALHFREHLTRSTFGAYAVSPEEAARSRAEVDRILGDTIAARRVEPGDDVISGLLENDLKLADGTSRKLTDQEIFSYCKLIIFAGGGTTWRQLGITIDALLTHDHFWEECRDDRSLLEPAIDEALRWRATDPYFPRLTTQDVEVEGVLIPKGVRVQICLGAGNRDPKVYERPDQYDIHRKKHHHMGLGLGPHRCLGMDVAKQEMIAAISGLMDRWPHLRLDSDQPKPRFVGLDHRGMTAVPVRFR